MSIADFAVARAGTRLITIGLGSCVAIALHAPSLQAGALAHVLLPHAALSGEQGNPSKFASTAVPHLVQQLRAFGAHADIDARLIGGASMFAGLLPQGAIALGARNVSAARAACAAAGIPIIAEDVGGGHGRSVYFDVGAGALQVRSLAVGDVDL